MLKDQAKDTLLLKGKEEHKLDSSQWGRRSIYRVQTLPMINERLSLVLMMLGRQLAHKRVSDTVLSRASSAF